MFYSKFLFENGAEKPTQAPPQSPDQRTAQLSQRVRHNIDKKRKAAEQLKGDKAELLKRWKENNPETKEKVPDDPKAVAVAYISNSKRAKEAYLLMALIEKKWKANGKETAWNLFKAAKARSKKPGDIDFKPFEEFFSRSNAGPKLGFYYRPSKDEWYTIDADDDNDDEAMGSTYLSDPCCYKKLHYEFVEDTKNKDSGLATEEEQIVLKTFQEQNIQAGKMIKEKFSSTRGKKVLIPFFRKQAENKWIRLDEKTISKMNLLYGAGVGKYLYRFVKGQKPEKDRIYMVLINGEKPEKNFGPAGYIEIDENGLGNWHAYDSADKLKALIDKMEAEQVEKELGREKVQAGETISRNKMLELTAHMISKIKGIKEAHPRFDELDKYYKDIEKKLKVELKRKGITKNVDTIIQARVDDIKAKIEAAIEKDEDLKEAREKHPTEKLTITVDSDDKVTVKIKSGLIQKLRKAREKATEAATSVEAVAKSTHSQLREKIKAKFGKASPIVLYFIDKVFKIGDGIKKLLSGKSAPITSMVLGFLGISVTPALIGAKKFNNKKFDKFLGSLFKNDQMKEAEHKKKFTLTQDYKLKGYTITIPKGKGIRLKKGAKLVIDGGVLENKAKKKKGKFHLFGGNKSEVLGKDQEIVIKDGTTIPAGTIITQMKVKRT